MKMEKDKIEISDWELHKAVAFMKHLEEHPEVIDAPLNPGYPMCKICYKIIDEIGANDKRIFVLAKARQENK